mmetsp:Transcript_12847/g.34596  ORF Transcript_12847/g.34596 Transcript_12847/m.34596 type:complete len:99 (+) Transcript_12847:76-372(+)
MAAFVGAGAVSGSAFVRGGAVSVRSVAVASRSTRRAAAAPKMSMAELATTSQLLAAKMEVTFPAYLAIFLGTLIPVAFLIILYIQSEARKAGAKSKNE